MDANSYGHTSDFGHECSSLTENSHESSESWRRGRELDRNRFTGFKAARARRDRSRSREHGGATHSGHENHRSNGSGRFYASEMQRDMLGCASQSFVRRNPPSSSALASSRAPIVVSKKNEGSKGLSSSTMKGDTEEERRKIATRLKNITYGKNTRGYERYVGLVPKTDRAGYSEHPRTPNPYEAISRRNWEGRIKTWRRELHKWDPPEEEEDLALAGLLGSKMSAAGHEAELEERGEETGTDLKGESAVSAKEIDDTNEEDNDDVL